MIQVQELSKRFGDTPAVVELSFELERGEILGLLGPNGAGKTTTLRMLTGFMPPDSGRVEINGKDLRDLGAELRRRSGYLPEGNPHYPELSVAANLDFWAALHGLDGGARRRARETLMEQCGLGGMGERPARELSKGYRQRLGLARALIHDPDIIFLDEPTAGLDPLHVRELRTMIRGFAGSKTVILCTHVLSEVEAVCDRVLILDRGRKALGGRLAELSGDVDGGCPYELRLRFAPEAPGWDGAPGLLGQPRLKTAAEEGARRPEPPAAASAPERWLLSLDADPESPAALTDWLQSRGARLYAIAPRRPDLESVFHEVVGRGGVG